MKKWYLLTIVLALLTIVSAVLAVTAQAELNRCRNVCRQYVDALQESQAELQNAATDIENLRTEKSALEQRLEHQAEEQAEEIQRAKFEFYYASLAAQRYGVDDLREYLSRWQWIQGAYEAGEFDCSEMTAYLEWKLENEGYRTIIVAGNDPSGDGKHAWLLVETNSGAYMPVEATSCSVVHWDNPNFDDYWEYEHWFETIQEALKHSPSEFKWWD